MKLKWHLEGLTLFQYFGSALRAVCYAEVGRWIWLGEGDLLTWGYLPAWVHICHLTLSGLSNALPFPGAVSLQSAYLEISQGPQLQALGQRGWWGRVMRWIQKTVMVVKENITWNASVKSLGNVFTTMQKSSSSSHAVLFFYLKLL